MDRTRWPLPSLSALCPGRTGCAVWAVLAAGWVHGEDDVVNFKVPRINEKGVMESVMTGERAKILPGKPMEVEGLRVLFFQPDGETVKLTVVSPGCVYDSREQSAESDQPVEIRGDAFQVEGVGYRYWMKEERMEIHDQVKVRFQGRRRDALSGEKKSKSVESAEPNEL